MKKPVILCIDDELMILRILEIELKKSLGEEYFIQTASGGEEALAIVGKLLAEGDEIVLIISDYIMPKMKGDELLQRLHIILPKAIKIMLTGQADIEAVGNAIKYAKLYRYISKPWQSEDLILTVKEATRSYFQEQKLSEQTAKLAEYNQHLESLVKLRTQELEEKNRLLEQEIRDRQQAEAALQASEAELKALFQAMSELIFVFDHQGYCLKVVPTNPNLLYKPAEEQIGQKIADVCSPDQAKLFLNAIQAALTTQQTINLEYTFKIQRINRYFSANISPISATAVIWVARDITERKHREEALRLIVEGTAAQTGQDFFRSCVRYLAEVLHVRYALVTEYVERFQSRVQTLAFWSGSDFAENLEYELVGTPCGETILQKKMGFIPENLSVNFPEDKILTNLGAESYAGMPLIDLNGNVLGHLAVFDTKPMENDQNRELILKIFAARAAAELERKRTEEALKASVYAADTANQAKSHFLSKMSHELRTPLNAILGFTQVMNRDRALSAEQQEQVGIINRSGEHLLALINDILEMSKIEAGRLDFKENSFNLYTLLTTLEEMLQLKASSKGIDLIFTRSPEVPPSIQTDESKLRQVLINLIGNAIKFTESGRVTLHVTVSENTEVKTQITAETPKAKAYLSFAIEDTGPGIAPEEMKLLFTPFGQTTTGRKAEQGTGLGLAISRQFIHLMKGTIQVRSTLNVGTTFSFFIPLKVADSAGVSGVQEPRKKVIQLAPDQPIYRILVVEDVKVSRLLLIKLLSALGFDVRAAGNGKEAIALWESWEPHLILMDMEMPVMDGYEATREIKARLQGKTTVIVALTANAFEEDRIAVLSAGCDDFISKPFQEEVILEKMAQYLGVRYIYEEPVTKTLPVADHNLDAIADRPLDTYLSQMPREWISQLYQAATQGSDDLIFRLLTQISEIPLPLATQLKEWANDFRFDKVIELIEKINA